MRKRTLLLPLLLASTVAQAQLFGINIGDSPDKFPLCDSDAGTGKNCLHTSQYGQTIELRPQRPSFMASNVVLAINGGKITSFYFDTKGVSSQKEAMDYLSTTLGKPASSATKTKQNSFGATFSVIESTWQTKNGAVVDFEGAKDRIDKGSITVF